ncbi:MAG: translocation/assembly module TamB domain-containing protein [Phormidesmis sp.]
MPTNPSSDRPSENQPPPNPNGDNRPERPSPKRPAKERAFPWFWLGTLVGTILGGAGLGLTVWAWIFIQEDLSPRIAQILSDYLERPVMLGDVEQVTFGSVQIGPSNIGASAEDSTTLTADSIIVNFDLIETLLTSELGLDLTVVGAEGYLAQDPERGWLNVALPERENRPKNRVEVNVDDVRFQKGELTLVPLPPEDSQPVPILLKQVRGELSTDKIAVGDEEALQTRFEIVGEPEKGGKITLKGEVTPVAAIAPSENDTVKDLDVATEELPAEVPAGAGESVTATPRKIAFATNLFIQADDAPLDDVVSFALSSINLATNDVAISSGQVSGNMNMAFRPDKPIDYSGNISAEEADVETELLPLPIENAAGETRFQGNKWTVDRLSGDYGEIKNVTAEGLIDFDNGYDLSAVKDNVLVSEFTNTISLDLPVPTTGRFDAIAKVSGPIARPIFSGSVVADRPVVVDKITFNSAASDFFLQGQQLFLNNIAATPTAGGAIQGNGQVRLSAGSPFTFQLAGRNLPASQIAALYDINPNFTIGLVSADATVVGNGGNVNTVVDWRAPNAQYAGSGTIDIVGTDLAFRNTVLAVGGGTVSGTGSLVDGFFNSDLTLQGIQLNAFSDTLQGDLGGQLQLSGSTDNASLETIKGVGSVTFSNGLASFNPVFETLNSPLAADVAWNGETIRVIQANSDRLVASGTLTPSFDNGFEIAQFNLDITAADYPLADLPFDIPDILDLSGAADVTGTLTGSPTAPNFRGNLQVAGFVANSLPFSSPLSGTVAYTSSAGLDLDVAGGGDRIDLSVGPIATDSNAIPPLAFNIGWRGASAVGQTQGDLLSLNANNFPLAALNFPTAGAADIGQLRGTLSANDFTVNLANQNLEGDIVIDQLGVGYISIGQLAGKVRYANDLATLTEGQLRLNNNLYTLVGSLSLDGPAPVYSASVNTQSGNVQNLLTALSIYRLEDFQRGLTPPDWLDDPLSPAELDVLLATASAGTTPTGTQLGFQNQLNRLAELDELTADAEIAAAAEPIPPLRELSGPFAGNIQLNGSGTDFQLDFDLAGRQWQWGDRYSAENVVARGSLTPNILTLEPLRFTSSVDAIDTAIDTAPDASDLPDAPALEETPLDIALPALPPQQSSLDQAQTPSPRPPQGQPLSPSDAAVDLFGQIVFGRDTELSSDLQARVQNIDITALRDILQLPVDVDGRANSRATLSGTLANPQIRGDANVANASINSTPIDSATAEFLYRDARLRIQSELTADTPEEPLRLSAQIPYAFGFMDVQPETEDINIDISVRDEGLALLNIFSQQVAWQSGEGEVNLLVGGTRSNIEITGNAFVDNAVITAKVLPEPLTGVSGRATFIDDRIVVETLQGSFSDGQLTAAGIFPLRESLISGPELATTAQYLPPASTEAAITNEGTIEGTPAETPANPPANPLLFPRPLAPNRPLTVNLENIDLELADLYRGGVNGQVIVGGNALVNGPQISGEVLLSDGQVLLPDGNGSSNAEEEATAEGDSPSVDQAIADLSGSGSPANNEGIQPVFRNLELVLGDSIRIVQGNLLNFVADGTLNLNGPPDRIEPEGVISLRSGRVSLYTQSFRLRGNNNIARFTPEMGLQNPFLDVSLRASVPEVNSSGTVASTPFAQAEIADNSDTGFETVGSLRTIRVRADVEGPANAIFENLTLSSSPPRSQSELIALIGGGFVTALESTVDSLGGGGDDFGGLLNLVGGALLNSLQDFVGDTLSLSEFRLFPVTSASRALSEQSSGTGFDIGAEIGFDVTEDASLSIGKILTDNSNPEFGANYRLTDSLTVRTNTNLDDINQVLLEYEIRF